MNLVSYTGLIRRWLIMAGVPTVAVMTLGYLYSAAQPHTYSTTAVLYVQQPSSNASASGSTDVETSRALIPTYSEMIQTPVIQQSVDRAMAHRYPGYSLEGHDLTVSRAGVLPGLGQQDTQLMDITVNDTLPTRAADAANTLARVFIHQIAEIQRSRFRGGARTLRRQLDRAQTSIQDVSRRIQSYSGPPEGRDSLRAEMNAYGSIFQTLLASQQAFNMARHIALNSVRVFSPAPVPVAPTGPHPARNSVLWGFVSFVASIGVIFVLDYLDDAPRSPEEVEDLLDAPVLGIVPKFRLAKGGMSLLGFQGVPSPVEDVYLTIRTNLGFMDVESPIRTVLVTSPSVGEGKSVTASNLACAFASAAKRIVLVDADLRRPALHRIFGLDPRVGLTTALAGGQPPTDLTRESVAVSGLSVIASGPLPIRPPDVLGSPEMHGFLEYLQSETEMVLIDSPPVLAVTDAALLSALVDGVVLVVDPAISTRREIVRARQAIEAVHGRILGVVINRLSRPGKTYYSSSYPHHTDSERSEPRSSEIEPQGVGL